jgi:capsular polysaccharide biosynthesis protein
MPLTLNAGDVPSSQPKVQVTTKHGTQRIGLIVTEGEVHEAQKILQDFTKCFAFSLKELGQLREQEVRIILEDDFQATLQA